MEPRQPLEQVLTVHIRHLVRTVRSRPLVRTVPHPRAAPFLKLPLFMAHPADLLATAHRPVPTLPMESLPLDTPPARRLVADTPWPVLPQ